MLEDSDSLYRRTLTHIHLKKSQLKKKKKEKVEKNSLHDCTNI